MEAPSTSTSTSTTVVTHHWQLEKYSRSRTVSSAPPPSDSTQPLAVEWDHYTQPRLALQLQAKYSNYPTASNAVVIPDQLLLQVTYDPLYRDRTPAQAAQAAQAAPPLLLDSIDLASFSDPRLAHATPKGQLPLKAVYRDAVLGLRYLVLGTRAAAAEFRRVQAKFTSTAERECFVDAIRVLVPVKPAAESATTNTTTDHRTTHLAAEDAPGTTTSSSSKKKKRKSTGQPPHSSIPLATPQSQSQQNQLATRRAKRARHAATVTASGSSSGMGGTRLDELYKQEGEYPPPLPPPGSTSSRPPSFLNAARSSFVVDNGLPYYSHQGQGQGGGGGGFLQPYQHQPQQITTTTTGGGGAAMLLGRSGSLASLLPRLAAAAASNSPPAPTAPFAATTTTTTTATSYNPTPLHVEDRLTYQTASLALLALEPDQLDKLLQDALLEEGFDRLVGTVKDALLGGGGGA